MVYIQPPRQIAGARSREREGSEGAERGKEKDREASERDTVFAARRPLPRVCTTLRKRLGACHATDKKGERVLRPLDY